MDVVILRNGNAVKTSNITDVHLNIYGFLSTFKASGKDFSYFTHEDLDSDSSLKKIPLTAGYYEVDAYSAYIVKPSEAEFKKLKDNFSFGSKFIPADSGQTIQVKIAHIASPYTDFYSYVMYTFQHVKGKNYLDKGNLRYLDITLMGNPSAPAINPGSSLQNNFYTRHIAHITDIPDDHKNEYAEYTIYSTLRIDMIVRDIFPILLFNPNNTLVLTDITTAISQITNNWNTNNCFENFSAESARSYRSHLLGFYSACFKNQKLIKEANLDKRMTYVIQAIPDEAAYLIPNEFMINVLKTIANKPKDNIESNDLELIIKIVMSFDENNPSKIDGFLNALVSNLYSLTLNSEYEDDFGDAHEGVFKREKVTLFERLFSILSDNSIYKLWHYSPLYKKIHTSLSLDEKASNRQIFVTCLYTLWIKSKYNPYRNNVFNQDYIGYVGEDATNKTFIYTRNPATTVHFNADYSYNVIYDPKASPLIINNYYYVLNALKRTVDSTTSYFYAFDKILFYSNQYENIRETGVNPTNIVQQQLNWIRGLGAPYGHYHIYQPIQIVNIVDKNKFHAPIHTWNENGNAIRQTYIPAFLYHFMKLKEHDEFVYAVIWNLIEAAYDGIPASKFTRFIDQANKSIDAALDFFDEIIPDSAFVFISDYSNSCSGGEFCRLIKVLDTWMQNYAAVKNNVVKNEIKQAAFDVVIEANANGWPNEFTFGSGLDAQHFIIGVSNADTSNQDNDRKNDILRKIKGRVSREEPEGNTTRGEGFSLFVWNSSGGMYTRTNVRLHTDASLLVLIEYGLDNNVPDHWIEGILTKAFRIKKPKTYNEAEAELLNASNLIKPLPAPGRGELLYCFNHIDEQTIFEELVKEKYIDKYEIYDIIAENAALTNTYYGGSVHTKLTPPDIDMVSYISTNKMVELANLAIQRLMRIMELGLMRRKKCEDLIVRIKHNINPDEQQNNIRVMAYCIYCIKTESNNLVLYNMGEEYKYLRTSFFGMNTNVLLYINLTEQQLRKRFDFVFITKEAAAEGRSIPPETPVNFND
ncbi:MAG TPA: hypothetical protein VJL37_11525 [Flavobacterium sp.]|nr:hypothetical protein [Flavobacterium sp.]